MYPWSLTVHASLLFPWGTFCSCVRTPQSDVQYLATSPQIAPNWPHLWPRGNAVHTWEEGPEKKAVQVLEVGLGSQILKKMVKKKRTWVLGGYIYLDLWTPGSMKSNAIQSDPGPQSTDLCPRSLFLSSKVASDSWKQGIYTSPDTFFSFGIELSFLAGK